MHTSVPQLAVQPVAIYQAKCEARIEFESRTPIGQGRPVGKRSAGRGKLGVVSLEHVRIAASTAI